MICTRLSIGSYLKPMIIKEKIILLPNRRRALALHWGLSLRKNRSARNRIAQGDLGQVINVRPAQGAKKNAHRQLIAQTHLSFIHIVAEYFRQIAQLEFYGRFDVESIEDSDIRPRPTQIPGCLIDQSEALEQGFIGFAIKPIKVCATISNCISNALGKPLVSAFFYN